MTAADALQGFLDQIFGDFSDKTVYFIMGALGSVLFLMRAVMMMIGGDGGGDFDVDADGGIEGHDGGFGIFSMLSIMSFMMGAGWLGLVARTDWGLGPVAAAASASGFGFLLMLLSSAGMYSLKRLQHQGKYDLQTAIGKTAKVYLQIPERGKGNGQVELDIDGRRSVISAVSKGGAIESFTAVRVTEVRDDGILIVEKL